MIIDDNDITSIPIEMGKLTNLEDLYMSKTHVGNYQTIHRPFDLFNDDSHIL